jgi:hypothetical protein
MGDMIQPTEQTLIFIMTISIGNELIPAHVYFARLSDDITFTRVVIHPGDKNAERTIDVDRLDQASGWIDINTGGSSPWSQLVASSLDYHIAQNNKQDNKD